MYNPALSNARKCFAIACCVIRESFVNSAIDRAAPPRKFARLEPGFRHSHQRPSRGLASNEGKAIYKQRAATSETVNADLRCYRGLTQLTVRGLNKIKCVVLWCALAYNLMHFAVALLS